MSLSLDALSLIQPGLGTVMIEYARRMGSLWFAGEVGNWDMVHYYQIIEMREILETGEITSAPALKSFESSFLDPLDQSILDMDKTELESACTAAIPGLQLVSRVADQRRLPAELQVRQGPGTQGHTGEHFTATPHN